MYIFSSSSNETHRHTHKYMYRYSKLNNKEGLNIGWAKVLWYLNMTWVYSFWTKLEEFVGLVV